MLLETEKQTVERSNSSNSELVMDVPLCDLPGLPQDDPLAANALHLDMEEPDAPAQQAAAVPVPVVAAEGASEAAVAAVAVLPASEAIVDASAKKHVLSAAAPEFVLPPASGQEADTASTPTACSAGEVAAAACPAAPAPATPALSAPSTSSAACSSPAASCEAAARSQPAMATTSTQTQAHMQEEQEVQAAVSTSAAQAHVHHVHHAHGIAAPSDHASYTAGPSASVRPHHHQRAGPASHKDHNSVTIKADTRVKDAAGAIFKVIDRLSTAFVSAIRVESSHEALNRAVKSIAVARKYVQDNLPGMDVSFLPFHR